MAKKRTKKVFGIIRACIAQRDIKFLLNSGKILRTFKSLESKLLSGDPIFRTDGSMIEEKNDKKIQFLATRLKIKLDPEGISSTASLNKFICKTRKKIRRRLGM